MTYIGFHTVSLQIIIISCIIVTKSRLVDIAQIRKKRDTGRFNSLGEEDQLFVCSLYM